MNKHLRYIVSGSRHALVFAISLFIILLTIRAVGFLVAEYLLFFVCSMVLSVIYCVGYIAEEVWYY